MHGTRENLAVAWAGDGDLGDSSGIHLSVHHLEALAPALHAQDGANPHLPPSFNPKHRPRPRKRPPVDLTENAAGGIAFDGIDFTGWNPPDPHMAAGPEHLVLVSNGEIRFYEKDGTLNFIDALHDSSGFFGAVGATLFVFDPEVLWDDDSQRFFITAVERDQLPPANGDPFILLAVSDDADPNGLWFKYRFDIRDLAGPGNLDSPNMSITPEAVFVGADMLSVGGSPQTHFIFILEKSALLVGQTPVERGLAVPGHRAAGMVVNTGDDAGAQYLIEADLTFGTHVNVQVHAVTDPLGTPQFQSTTVTVPSYNNPEDPPGLGTTLRIETFDARFWSCMYRNGSLWATHHVNSTNVRQRWYEIALNEWPSGGSPELVQSGDILPGNGLRTLFGSIWADVDDRVAMVFSTTGVNEYVSIRSTHRLSTDPLDEMGPIEVVRESTFPFIQGSPSSRRWGDYSAVVSDPTRAGTFWMHSEYKNTTTWKTWVSELVLDVPVPTIIDSMPPSLASDARQPVEGKDNDIAGWDEIDLLFDGPVNVMAEDFMIETSGGSVPVVVATPSVDDMVTVVLDQPIPAGECTTLTYLPDGSVIELGYLPADVDGDGQAGTLDILKLIDNLNGFVDPPLASWQCDVDRSDECNPLDVLRVIDLLNGADAFQSWLGRELPPCP